MNKDFNTLNPKNLFLHSNRLKGKLLCFLLPILFLFFSTNKLFAQPCTCINCPGKIVAAGNKECSTTEFLYFVSGASSNALEDPFQGVCAVNLSFKADNIFQINMYLISPGGDTVKLICPDAGPGIGVTALTTWNISMLPNSNAVFPDPGFSPTWTNYDPWETGVDYFGTYHPCEGALEDFSNGPVNGPWRLVVKNFAPLNKGELLDFSIVFCDETGIECGCLAYAGSFPGFTLIDACQGSAKLKLDLKPNYNGYAPDTNQYNFTYAIANPSNLIIAFDTMPNLIAYPVGNYKVCGLSYLVVDSSAIFGQGGNLKLDSIYNEINSPNPDYCADLAKNCVFVNINAPPPPVIKDMYLCKDSCIVFKSKQYCMPGTFNIDEIDSLGCTNTYVLNLYPAVTKFQENFDTICKGEYTIFGTDFINKAGTYEKTFKSFTGCDSTVTLHVVVIDINLSILPADTLNCVNSQIDLEGINSGGSNFLIKYSWTATNGGSIISDPSKIFITVDSAGKYTLTGKYTFKSGKTCSEDVSVNVIKKLLQPELTNVPDQFLCNGTELDLSKLNIKEINGLPGKISFHSALPPSVMNQINPLVIPDKSIVYYAYFKTGQCSDVVPINIFVNSNPTAEVKPFVNVCNSDMNGKITQIKFDSLVVSGDKTGFWVDADGSGASGTFPILDFTGITPGTYTFAYFTQSAVPPCQDSFYTVSVIVEDCECPSLAIINPGDLCNNNIKLDLNTLLVTTAAGTWTIFNAPGGSTAVIIGSIFNATNTKSGNYTIRFTLNTLPPAGCASFVDLDFKINAPPIVTLTSDVTVCNSSDMGNGTLLDLNSSILSADKSGNWTDLNASGATGSFPLLDFKDVLPGLYKFKYASKSAVFPCAETKDTLVILVKDCSCPIVSMQSKELCNTKLDFDLNTLILSGQTGKWFFKSKPVGSNPAILSNNILEIDESDSGKYILGFKLDNAVVGCQDSFATQVNLISSPITVLDTLVSVCNSNLNGFVSVLDFSSLLKSGDLGGTWSEVFPSGAVGTLPILDFNNVIPGSYFFKYTSNSATSPCKESEYLVRVVVEDCTCPSILTKSPGKFCNNGPSIDLDNFKITTEPGTWAIVMVPPGTNPASVNGNLFASNNSDPGDYILQFTLLNSPPFGCPTFSNQSLTLVAAPFATVLDTFKICNKSSSGQTTLIDFNTLITAGDKNGTWSDVDNSGALGVFPNLDFQDILPGKYKFQYQLKANLPCKNINYDVVIEVADCSCPEIIISQVPDICNTLNSLDLSTYIGNNIKTDLLVTPLGQANNILNSNILSTKDILGGQYLIEASLINAPPPNCPVNDTLFIQVSEMKSAGTKIKDIDFCQNSDTSIYLFDLLISADLGGNWQIEPKSAGLNLISSSLDIKYFKAGNYTISYIQSNKLPCTKDSVQINLVIHEEPIADAGQDQSLDCGKDSVVLGGVNNANIPNIVFSWTGGTLLNVNAPNPSVDVAGTYTLWVKDSISGCINTDQVLVTGSNTQSLQPFFTVVQPKCKGQPTGSIEISMQFGGNPPFLYSISNKAFQANATFKNLIPGSYYVQVEDATGCNFDTTIVIYSTTLGGIELGKDTIINFGDSLQFKPILNIDLSQIDTIIWTSFGDLSCSDCLMPWVKPYIPTRYDIKIITKDGCEYFDEIRVNIKKELKYFIPNVFSPNGDGINDVVDIYLGPEIVFVKEFEIFDRWGEKVFSMSKQINSLNGLKTWDGKLGGQKMNPGVFVYFGKFILLDGSEEIVTGEISLLN